MKTELTEEAISLMKPDELRETITELQGLISDRDEALKEMQKECDFANDQLDRAADILADNGLLINTPQWKARWVSQNIGLLDGMTELAALKNMFGLTI